MPAKKHLDLLDLKADMEFILDKLKYAKAFDAFEGCTDKDMTEMYQRIEAINDNLIEMGIGDE